MRNIYRYWDLRGIKQGARLIKKWYQYQKYRYLAVTSLSAVTRNARAPPRKSRHAVRPPFMPSLSLTCVQAEAAARGGARSLRLFAVKRSVFLESQCSGQHLLLLRPCAPGSCSRHCQPCQSKLWSTHLPSWIPSRLIRMLSTRLQWLRVWCAV